MDPTFLSAQGVARGSRRDIVVPAPAAGAEWSFILPAGGEYRVLIASAQLATSAVVANRFPGFGIFDGDGFLRWAGDSQAAIAASLSVQVGYALGGSTSTGASGTITNIGLPAVILPAGWRIGSRTPALDAGDQYSAIRLYIDQLWDDEPWRAAGAGEHHHRQVQRGHAHAA